MKNKILISVFLLLGMAVGYYYFYNTTGTVKHLDPISFSHYVHTKQHKIKCQVCHRGVETEMRAGIPNIDVCSMCHSSIIDSTSKRELVIYNYVKDNKIIPWKALYNIPDYVYFSHRRHVKMGKLECSECHGDMTTQTSPELKNFTPFKMQFCFDCHQNRGITTDCGNCHH